MTRSFLLFFASLVTLHLSSFAQAAGLVSLSGGNAYTYTSSVSAAELSGLTYSGVGSTYYAVSDAGGNEKTLFEMDITLGGSGVIQSANVDSAIALGDAGAVSDAEGVTLGPGGDVFVAYEGSMNIARFAALPSGAYSATMTPPAPLTVAKRSIKSFLTLNFTVGLESLAYSPSDGMLWTANEEATQDDGPLSSTANGTVVRLAKIDPATSASVQYAYEVFAAQGFTPGFGSSGLADLAVLPNGTVLSLERAFGASGLTGRSTFSIYELDFSGANDISAVTDASSVLAQHRVGKTLLDTVVFTGSAPANFEGLTIGPQIDGGDYGLLLISDDGGGAPAQVYSYRLTLTPEPVSFGLAGIFLCGWLCAGFRRG